MSSSTEIRSVVDGPASGDTQRPARHWPVLKSYRGRQLDRLAMPIGGIGTGTVSLGGRGDLRDWEIVNRPAKGFNPGQAFFAIRAAADGVEPFARCLEGPVTSGFEGWSGAIVPHAGLPRFTNAEFHAAYPLGQVVLAEPGLPIDARIEAFNPMVPSDPDASGLPVAYVRFVVRNRGDVDLDVSVAGVLENFIGRDGVQDVAAGNVNELAESAAISGVTMRSEGVPAGAEQWGSLALATYRSDDGVITRRRDWTDTSWRGPLLDFWDDLVQDGDLDDREPAGRLPPIGSVCHRRHIPVGEERTFEFQITWHFPNRQNWETGLTSSKAPVRSVGNWYTTQFSDAWDASVKVAEKIADLERETVEFVSAFCGSPLPEVVKEAALFNASTLRTQTFFRTEDGHAFGWEGCQDNKGSCHGSCTHVWNYEQATAFLFGPLARSMREVEFLHATDDRGLMSFRVNLPLEFATAYGVAASDGQPGCIMKLYREWKLSGDEDWLRTLWPKARLSLEFFWVEGGWDADVDGVMEGCQHNTMDVEYFGPNPQMQFWYLGALRAAEEMALHLGESAFAAKVRDLFERGRDWTDSHLFNGEYYEHEIRPPLEAGNVAKGLAHHELNALTVDDLADPPLQLGKGCLIDQLVGQYMSAIVGLGDLGDPDKTRTTLESIRRHNHRETMAGHFNHMRSYVLGDEPATLMCSYPRGERPARPFPYFTEVMTGFEYTLAVHMLYAGLTDMGLGLIEDIRSRYTGERRSPFNEAECGHHYSRAMASWGAVLALTGFDYDGRAGRLTIRLEEGAAPTFWSTGNAWGTAVLDGGKVTVRVRQGTIDLREVVVNQEAPRLVANPRLLSRDAAVTV